MCVPHGHVQGEVLELRDPHTLEEPEDPHDGPRTDPHSEPVDAQRGPCLGEEGAAHRSAVVKPTRAGRAPDDVVEMDRVAGTTHRVVNGPETMTSTGISSRVRGSAARILGLSSFT